MQNHHFRHDGRTTAGYVRAAPIGFITNLLECRTHQFTDEIDALRDAARRQRFPFRMDALVVLPDHIHAVWTLISVIRFAIGYVPAIANRRKRLQYAARSANHS